MKHLLGFALIALISTSVFAGPRDLGTKAFTELPTLAGSAVATGDFIPVYDVSARNVVKVSAAALPLSAFDAVASGQSSKAVTVTGVTTASKCVASLNEATTNAVYVRGVVPTTNTVTVTLSGDPGASNADISVICTR